MEFSKSADRAPPDPIAPPKAAAHANDLAQALNPADLLLLAPGILVDHLIATEKSGAEIADILSKAAPDLVTKLIESGLPKSPNALLALSELYSPQLLRNRLIHTLETAKAPTEQLSGCLALAFIFNPRETLKELHCLKRMVHHSIYGDWFWGAADHGLINGCIIQPERWETLLKNRPRLGHGPEAIERVFAAVPENAIISLPAPIAERVLANKFKWNAIDSRPPCDEILKLLALASPETISQASSIFERPGALPMLKFLRQASGGSLPPNVVPSVLRELDKLSTTAETKAARDSWSAAHRPGEAARFEAHCSLVFNAVRSHITSWYELQIGRLELGVFPTDTFKDKSIGFAPNQSKIARRTVKYVQSQIQGKLAKSSIINDSERKILTDCLEATPNHQLSLIDRISEYYANRTPIKHPVYTLLKTLQRAQDGELIPDSLLSDLLTVPRDDNETLRFESGWFAIGSTVARLNSPHQILSACIANFPFDQRHGLRYLPDSHQHAPFAVLRLFLEYKLGDNAKHLLNQSERWSTGTGSSELDFYSLREQYPLDTIRIESVLAILAAIPRRDREFLDWRAEVLRELSKDYSIAHLIRESPVLAEISLGNLANEEVPIPPHLSGTQIIVRELKLTDQERSKLSEGSRQALKELELIIDTTFSQFNLPTLAFSRISEILQLRGYEPKRLDELKLIVRGELKKSPNCVATRKVLEVISDLKRSRVTRYPVLKTLKTLESKKALLQVPRNISDQQALISHLNRYGVSNQIITNIIFPTLEILRQRRRNQNSNGAYKGNSASATQSIRQIRSDNLGHKLALCREKLVANGKFTAPLRLRDIMRIPLQRRMARNQIFTLLAAAGSIQGLASYLTSVSLDPNRASANSSHNLNNSGLEPNGTIPKSGEPLCELSALPKEKQNRYFITGLIGTGEKAIQPRLEHSQPLANSLVHMLIEQLSDKEPDQKVWATYFGEAANQAPYPPLPIGASITGADKYSGLSLESRRLRPKIEQLSVELNLVSPPKLDQHATVFGIQRDLGFASAELTNARLTRDELRQIAPELEAAIGNARTMPAAAAAEYLRTYVREMIKYQPSPEYDRPMPSIGYYLETILTLKRGLCGQFALIYDEALKHVGIPATIVTCYTIDGQSKLIRSNNAHATNLVILRSSDGELVPTILDATGAYESRSDLPNLEQIAVPAGLLGALGGSLLAIRTIRRRRSAWLNGSTSSDDDKETPLISSLMEQSPTNSTNSRGKSVEELVDSWIIKIASLRGSSLERDRDLDSSSSAENWSAELIAESIAELLKIKDEIEQARPEAKLFMHRTGAKIDPAIEPVIAAWMVAMRHDRFALTWANSLKRTPDISNHEVSAVARAAKSLSLSSEPTKILNNIAGNRFYQLLTRPQALPTELALKIFSAPGI
jgi:hypothetical protein